MINVYRYYLLFIILAGKKKTISRLVQKESPLLGRHLTKTCEKCEKFCEEHMKDGCRSFGYCQYHPGEELPNCYLFNQILKPNETFTNRTDCHWNHGSCSSGTSKLKKNFHLIVIINITTWYDQQFPFITTISFYFQ